MKLEEIKSVIETLKQPKADRTSSQPAQQSAQTFGKSVFARCYPPALLSEALRCSSDRFRRIFFWGRRRQRI
jgi:hypothetical protein